MTFDLEKVREANHDYLDLQYQLDSAEAEIERLRGEMENYGDDYVCQMKSKDTRIQELEDALVEERVIGEGGFRAEQCEVWYIEDLPEESCMELDGPCDWAKCPRKHELCDVAYQQLAEEGKIGPDADAKPHCWQITEERKAAIRRAMEFVIFADSDSEEQESEDVYAWRVLQAMLEEIQ